MAKVKYSLSNKVRAGELSSGDFFLFDIYGKNGVPVDKTLYIVTSVFIDDDDVERVQAILMDDDVKAEKLLILGINDCVEPVKVEINVTGYGA